MADERKILLERDDLSRAISRMAHEILERNKVDKRLEHLCKRYYKPVMGRPSMAPGVYFRMLLLGYFEGIDSERGIAWRVADSFSFREFLGFSLTESTPGLVACAHVQSLRSRVAHQLPCRDMSNLT